MLRVNYDFHWQLSYRLAEPRLLKAGTELQAVAWYDNSRNNPHNPDPDSAVRWGDQTYDEMMVGFFDVAVPAEVDKTKYFDRSATQKHAGAAATAENQRAPSDLRLGRAGRRRGFRFVAEDCCRGTIQLGIRTVSITWITPFD